MLATTKVYRRSLHKNSLKQNTLLKHYYKHFFLLKLLEVLSDWTVFILKSYHFVIYLVSIFLVYLTKCCQSMAWFYLQKIQIQLLDKRSKRNTGGLHKCHMLSQTSITVNWEILQANMLCTPKEWLDEHSNMLEMVQWGFYPEVHRRTCHPVTLLVDREFWSISREKCYVFFYSKCNKL